MGNTFRLSMAWLHTWAGVVIGSVLFAMFWMGTLSVFDREIDRWMMPATRLSAPPATYSLDRSAVPAAAVLAASSPQWSVVLPSEREPVLRFGYRDADGKFVNRAVDPATGALLPEAGSKGGTGFIFRFHYMLNLKWMDLGYWLAGIAAMSMLLLLVSGVIIHRRIFSDFFTFRPRKQMQRASLDLHNLSGVVALPFHFMIALSGLIIFIGVYFPQAHEAAYGASKAGKDAYQAESFGRYVREKAGKPGSLASLDAMVARAEQEWSGGRPYFVRVWNPGDANAYVEMRRSFARDITMHLDQVYFDAATGQVLKRFEAGPVWTAQRFISGLHFIQFEHWTLRWLYFAGGLSGCVMIATGFLFWLESRRASHAKKGLRGVRAVEGLTIGSVTGIVVATLVYFAANRLLPADAALAGYDRADLEVWAFYLAWIATFAHAWLRPGRAWRQQAWTIAVLAPACVLLNAVSTGDHLLRTVSEGLWSIAGMDGMLLAGGALAAVAALRLGRKAQPAVRRAPAPAEPAIEPQVQS